MSDIQEEQKRLYKRVEENDIKLLREENKKLKDLCDKYEEEHKTTFEEWKKDIKANKKAIEYIENVIRYYNGQDIEKAFYLYIHKDSVHDLLNILKGDNK